MKKTFIDENGDLNEWNGKLYPLDHAVKLAYGKTTRKDIERRIKLEKGDGR